MSNILIAGAGLTGISLARMLADKGHKVTIFEKTDKLGGLCRDEYISGVLTHVCGPHYFNSNNKKVFDWLKQFCDNEFITKDYIVKSSIRGKLYDFPININTINEFFDINLKTEKEVKDFLNILSAKWKDIEPSNSEEIILKTCGRQLYETFFEGYTTKMWDKSPDELDASICARIPLRFNKEKIFHKGKYKGVPKYGYTKLFENILNHKNITIYFNVDYIELTDNEIETDDFDLTIFTGPIDSYFKFKHGQLPYRSLKFEIYIYPFPFKYNYNQINYPGKEPYTRDSESKHMTGQDCKNTTIVRETPCYDNDNPMYPVLTKESYELLDKYLEEAEKVKDKVVFAGRLGTFAYQNMDVCVDKCFELVKQLTKDKVI